MVKEQVISEKLGAELFMRRPELNPCREALFAAYETLVACYRAGGKLLVCGNGGSAADAEHIVGELMKGFLLPRPLGQDAQRRIQAVAGAEAGEWIAAHLQGGLPALALTAHTAFGTAFVNDVAAETVFAQQVYILGQPGDVVLGLTTSGNSANVVNAFIVARAFGLKTICFTGARAGRILPFSDVALRVPYTSTPQIQEAHLCLYHTLCAMVEAYFFAP